MWADLQELFCFLSSQTLTGGDITGAILQDAVHPELVGFVDIKLHLIVVPARQSSLSEL